MKERVKFTIEKDPARYGYKIEIDLNLDALELEKGGSNPGPLFIKMLKDDFRYIIFEIERMMKEDSYKKYFGKENFHLHLPKLQGLMGIRLLSTGSKEKK